MNLPRYIIGFAMVLSAFYIPMTPIGPIVSFICKEYGICPGQYAVWMGISGAFLITNHKIWWLKIILTSPLALYVSAAWGYAGAVVQLNVMGEPIATGSKLVVIWLAATYLLVLYYLLDTKQIKQEREYHAGQQPPSE